MRINTVDLEKIVTWLRNVIKATGDKRLVSSYSEYLVAYELHACTNPSLCARRVCLPNT